MTLKELKRRAENTPEYKEYIEAKAAKQAKKWQKGEKMRELDQARRDTNAYLRHLNNHRPCECEACLRHLLRP